MATALSTKKKLVFSIIMLFVVFGSAEVLLRIGGFSYNPFPSPIILWNTRQDKLLRGGQSLHQVDASTLWSPRPAAVVPWNPDEKVNEGGFRGDLVPVEKPPGTFRVATFGDSSTFGLGVTDKECWSHQLQKALTQQHPEKKIEVINAGVVGFTIVQGYKRFENLVAPYDPDLIVLAFGAVNEHFPAIKTDDEKIQISLSSEGSKTRLLQGLVLALRTSQLVFFIKDTIQKNRVDSSGIKRDHKRDANREHKKYSDGEEYQRRVTSEEFATWTKRFVDEAKSRDTSIAFLSFPRRERTEEKLTYLLNYTRTLASVAAAEKVTLVDARQYFRDILEGKLKAPPDVKVEDDLFVDEHHPTPIGHEIIANLIVQSLTAQDTLSAQ